MRTQKLKSSIHGIYQGGRKDIEDFYLDYGKRKMKLDTTTVVCQVVMNLKKKKLMCDDWVKRASESAIREWGVETTITWFEDYCVVRNKKTGNQKKIILETY